MTEPVETTILSKTSAAYLDCLADGNPKPEYAWYKGAGNSMSKVETGSGRRFVLTGGQLTIDNPEDKDEGTYQCRATNEFGTILSRRIALSFGSKFRIQNRLFFLTMLAAALGHCGCSKQRGQSCQRFSLESLE